MNRIDGPSRQLAATIACGGLGTVAANFLHPQTSLVMSGTLLILIAGLSASAFVCAIAGVFRGTLRVASGVTQSIFLILISFGSIATLPPEAPASGILSAAILGAESPTQKAAVARLAQDALQASSADSRQAAAKMVYVLSGQVIELRNEGGFVTIYSPTARERDQHAKVIELMVMSKKSVDDILANEFTRQVWKLLAGVIWLVSFGVALWWVTRDRQSANKIGLA